MSKQQATELSIFDLDLTKDCEKGFEFEYLHPATGKGTGFFVTVLGEHAASVQEWVRKRLNEIRMRNSSLMKRGADIPVSSVEEDQEFGVERVAICITGWRGAKEEFSREHALKLCTFNPDFRAQVKKASDNLANFTGTSLKGC